MQSNNPSTPLRAAIDIGSNSVRFAMTDGTVRSFVTQLADGLAETTLLSPRGVDATIAALGTFADEAHARGCSDITAFATEAVRRASNGAGFCARVLDATGLRVNVLTPECEARLALAGAGVRGKACAVADLGGGSLELICSADGVNPNYVKSLPLGVVVLKNKYNGDYRAAIDELPALLKEYGQPPEYPPIVCGGSACAIAAAMLNLAVYDRDKVSTVFSVHELDEYMPMLLSPKPELFRPILAKRADTVPYGAIVIRALMGYLGATEFRVSDSGNLEAVLAGAELECL